ncbi:MAG: MlaD family protein [Aeromicrobium sp.]|uniref:MCE family protein n=1 Tax=Aeromicrobium sp. TaxID=1871063 RepID=UPI0039E6C459
MNYGVRIKFTIFAVIAVMLMVIIYNTMANSVGGEVKNYTAEFTSVSGLREGDDVRAAGVRVGRVENIELSKSNRAKVEFTLGEGQSITDTTVIKVKYQNLLGQRYLSLDPSENTDAQGKKLDPDKLITASQKIAGTEENQTDPGFDLTMLLNGFEPLFETLQPSAVNELATSVVSVLQGEGGTVESLLEQTAILTQDLANKDQVIGEVLTNLTPVLQNLSAQEANFNATVDQLSSLMAGLAAERETITGAIDGVSALAQATASLTAELRTTVPSTVASVRAAAETLVGHQAALDQLFEAAPDGFDSFTRPTNTGTWLNMYICVLGLEGLPSILGGTLDPLPPTADPLDPNAFHSETCS